LAKYQILAQFLNFWNCPVEIKMDILPLIDSVLSNDSLYVDIGAEAVGVAYVEAEKTKLLGSELGDEDFCLGSGDFKGIILEWLSEVESKKNKNFEQTNL